MGASRRLWEDDHGHAFAEPLDAALQDGLQIVAGVRAPNRDGVPGAHDMPEHGVLDEALLDHEGDPLERQEDDGKDEGLERAHVIADEDTGTLQARHVLHP